MEFISGEQSLRSTVLNAMHNYPTRPELIAPAKAIFVEATVALRQKLIKGDVLSILSEGDKLLEALWKYAYQNLLTNGESEKPWRA